MISSSGCHILLDVFTPSFVIAMLAYYDPVANSCLRTGQLFVQVGCECDLGNDNIISHRNKFSVRIGVEWRFPSS